MNSGKNSKALCLGATIFLGLALGCAPTLAGKLTDQSGEFIASPDARVNITSLKNPEQGSIVVKADGGSWSTDSDLEPGDYLVEALVPGYGLVSKRITLGETDELSLVLSRLEKAAPSAIGGALVDESNFSGSTVLDCTSPGKSELETLSGSVV